MGKKKWCFGRRDVICHTVDCVYMRECIVRVAQERAAEFAAAAQASPRSKLATIKKKLRKERRRSRRST